MSEWIDPITSMTDYEFMRTYRTPYWHTTALKAASDQGALGSGRAVRGDAPTGEAARIAAERERRGLVWPDSWETAGLEPHK